jgi:hypothetical protein
MKRIAIVAAGILAASAGPALAKQCPAGQIFRVSKGSCMAKSAALKAGISIGGHRRQVEKTAVARTAEPAAKDEPPTTRRPKPEAPVEREAAADPVAAEPARSEPAPAAPPAEAPKAPGGLALGFSGPWKAPGSSGSSPFGGLSFGAFGLR